MKQVLLLLAYLAALGVGMGPGAASAHSYAQYHLCGRERWAAKTFADGVPVDAAHPIASTVLKLRALARPAGVDGFDARRVPAEQRVYRVHADLLGARLEQDGDFHLVIAQPGDRRATMVAEIPDAERCMRNADPALRAAVARARAAFVREYGMPPSTHFAIIYRPIDLTGALFFDFLHGQDGVAPNGAEIHSVIAVGGGAEMRVIAGTYSATASTACGASDPRVWVNTRSGIYHYPGSRWYGHTREGEFMCRSAADAHGYRAARNEGRQYHD